jgi:hypothetical protein
MAGLVGLSAAGLGQIGPRSPAEVERQGALVVQPQRWLRPVAANLDAHQVVADCIDGRRMFTRPAAPRAAGGTLALLFALVGAGGSADNLVAGLRGAGFPLWIHDDCGANDALGGVVELLASHGAQLDALRGDLGLAPGRADRGLAVAQLTDLAGRTTADGRRGEFVSAGIEADHALGGHAELAVIVNQVPGTTVDRASLPAGDQVFALDVWAYRDSAAALLQALPLQALPAQELPAQEPIDQSSLADAMADLMIDLSLAAVCALCGPTMVLTVAA